MKEPTFRDSRNREVCGIPGLSPPWATEENKKEVLGHSASSSSENKIFIVFFHSGLLVAGTLPQRRLSGFQPARE